MDLTMFFSKKKKLVGKLLGSGQRKPSTRSVIYITTQFGN